MRPGARGRFRVRVFGADGRLKRRSGGNNTCTLEGLAYFGRSAILDKSANAAKRCGLIGDTGWSGVSASDEMANHPGWQELDTGARRPVVSGSTTLEAVKTINIGTFVFDDPSATYPLVVRGAFIVDAGSLNPGDTSGFLWCVAAFDAPVEVESGDSLSLSYVITEGNYPTG